MTRDAIAIGAGLASARTARPIRHGERIHVVGAAGAGASAAALLARRAGGATSGCDAGGPSPYTVAVEAAGITLSWTHDPGHVTGSSGEPPPDRLGVTKALTSIQPDHPELVAARERGIPTEPWQQVVADAASGRRLVAVAGTHGKSTTAGWLVHVLVEAGADPSAFVGALMPGSITGGPRATARWGRGPMFVVEADEYAGNFDPYRPSVAVVTSIEWDHPDVFADRTAVVDAFERWLRAAGEAAGEAAVDGPSILIANIADAGTRELVGRLRDWPGGLVTVALEDGPVEAPDDVLDLRGRIASADPDGTTLDVPLLGTPIRIPLAGRHNAANALAVAAAAGALGIGAEAVAAGLASFPGVGRRLERMGEAGGVVVYDDYAHHPTAIRATLEAVRQREPGRRTWAVYEPLTYHRTAALLEDFADALAEADGVAIAAIWSGRDPDTSVASADGLAEAISRRRATIPVEAPGTVEETAAWLATHVRPGDAVLVMGGGRSYRIVDLLLERLGGK